MVSLENKLWLACLLFFLWPTLAGGENSNSPEYNSSRYASKMEIKYEMKVPDRILLVGKELCANNVIVDGRFYII